MKRDKSHQMHQQQVEPSGKDSRRANTGVRPQNLHHLAEDDSWIDDVAIELVIPDEELAGRRAPDDFTAEMDEDEYGSYTEFLRCYIEGDIYGPLRGINEHEYKYKLTISTGRDGRRDISVKELGTKPVAKTQFSMPAPDIDEVTGVDISAFNTHDFEKSQPTFDKQRYKLQILERQLHDYLLSFATIQHMTKETYERMRQKILNVYDEIKELKQRRQQRLALARERAFASLDTPSDTSQKHGG